MAKHPTSRRVHRDAETEDAFVARVVEYTEWARRHSRAVTVGAVVLVLLLAGFLYYQNYQTSLRNRAISRLTEIQQTAASGNAALAIRDLEGFLDSFGGTTAAGEARLMLAQLYLEGGRHQEAAEVVSPLAEDLDEPLGVSAAFLRAAAHEESDRGPDAERVYLRIAEGTDLAFQRERALSHAARIRMAAGNPAGAAELYRRLLDSVEEDDPQRGLYEMRLAEATAAAAVVEGGT